MFALTANGMLEHRTYSGRWGVWLDLGGQWTSDLGVVSQRNASVDIFEKGLDGQLKPTTLPSPSF